MIIIIIIIHLFYIALFNDPKSLTEVRHKKIINTKHNREQKQWWSVR